MPGQYLQHFCNKIMNSVSVVIPTLNEARNIETLLRALEAQQFDGELQIIVSDGNSADGTLGIVHQHPQVLAVQTERGVSHQRNAGAEKATGELIIFMDADDRPAPTFVCDVVRSYRRFPFAVACPWFVARDAGLSVRVAYWVFNLLFWLGQSTLRTGSGVCIIARREAWEKCGGFDENLHLGEDVHFLRRASPRYGWHRHLLVPLETSGRRYARDGFWKLSAFYTRIAPLIVCGLWKPLQKQQYRADYGTERKE